MKTLFIPVKSKSKLNEKKILDICKKLPENIAIAYSIQYKEIAHQIKNLLKQKNITSFVQVLGCSSPKPRKLEIFGALKNQRFLLFPKNTEAILLITDGKFHAVSLALESNLPVYILCNNQLEKISDEYIKSLKMKKKASYLKFLNSDKIGILISTKPGQENLKKALEFKKHAKKKSYLFICNNINKSEFENFPEIQCWINTACPRLDFDLKVINIGDLKNG